MLKRTAYCVLHRQALVQISEYGCAVEKITVNATGEEEIRFCYYKPNGAGNPQVVMRPLDVPEDVLLELFQAAIAEEVFTEDFRHKLKRLL